MRVGRNRNSWVKNCVSIGLASGFVEPLESTGIFFIQHAIEQLVTYFPRGRNDEFSIKSYNQTVADLIDGVREFLTLHYVAGTRSDNPFWKSTKNDLFIPEGLKERLDLWKVRLPSKRTIKSTYHGFPQYSYCSMLLGLGHRPAQNSPILDHMGDAAALQVFDRIRAKSEQLKRSLPSHYEYLAAKYGRPEISIGTAG